jgi:hypothetical protein
MEEVNMGNTVSFLKKIGIILASASSDITKVLGFPFVSQLLGMIPGKLGADVKTAVVDLNTFAGFVTTAEVMFPSIDGAKTGSAKLTAASPLFQKAILAWAGMNLPGHNKLLVTPEVFASHVTQFTSDFATIMNDFGE